MVTNDQKIKFYHQMLRIRKFEERMYALYSQGEIFGTVHPSIGQEAVAVGVCLALDESDYITTTHRGHGHVIAKGASLKSMMAELYGKENGSCKGKGGSMHISEVQKGILGATGIVGAGIPIATGAALTAKYRKSEQVCVAFFGDGASNQGTFHESLNMAGAWRLPILFVCENNQYALTCKITNATACINIADRGQGYNIPGIVVDGMDVIEVYKQTSAAIKRAREGNGPTLMECKTYRFTGHSRGDPAYGPYRSKEEYDSWKAKDPITLIESKLKITKKEKEEILNLVEVEIEEAVKFAANSSFPNANEAYNHVFA